MAKESGIVNLPETGPTDVLSLRRRLRDYATIGRELFLQRIIIYSAAIALAAGYYDWRVALFFYAMVWVAEAYDAIVFKRILRWRGRDVATARQLIVEIYVGTALSATVISLFSISVAVQQGHTTHFMPLFMLFSAAIFAAMNNHHFISVLGLRLVIYVAALLFIPIRDLVAVQPPMSSELWLQFLTVLFVLIFIMECARNFIAGYMRNLRHIKELEQEHEQTKVAYKAKSEFLATVSHELRTPLTSIKGSLDLINSGVMGPIPDKMKMTLDLARRNSGRLADLINDLLDLQRADAGRMEFNLELCDLGVLMKESVARMRPIAEELKVTLTCDVPEARFWTRADRKRIDQVITNLLSNAAKFSNSGGEVRVSVEDRDGMVRILVADDGIGLPREAHDRVFEEFSQLDSSDQRKIGGTGLGLNISKRIVEAHGGVIDYEGELGVGTTFFVDLEAAAPTDRSQTSQAA